MDKNQVLLPKRDIPKKWYNLAADLPAPMAPPLHPGTKKPASAEDMGAIFSMPILEQEMTRERTVAIPDEVLKVLALWRPTPLIRARRLEAVLETPAQIWYKYEGCSPSGSHKTNTSVPQAYYNKLAGVKRIATETGAGQWGTALAYGCYEYGLACQVYMVKCSYTQKPYRRSLMHLWNADVVGSPSQRTEFGRKIHHEDPECPGSLGIAISEAIEDTLHHKDTKYALGSVLNHVILHQTIIGQEAKEQFKRAGVEPDVLIGCAGGGSNFAGFTFPFCADKIAGNAKYRLLAAEPSACPSITKGELRYDFGDTEGMTPLMKMHTLGHDFIPPGIHAGGLRYHGMAPMVSAAIEQGFVEGVAVPQVPVFEAAVMFARTEGIVPAPESSHAIRVAIDEALKAKRENRAAIIGFCLSGHGLLDMSAYDAYFTGKLIDHEYEVPAKA